MGHGHSRAEAAPDEIIDEVERNNPRLVKVSFCKHHPVNRAQILRLFAHLKLNSHVQKLKLTDMGVEDSNVLELVEALKTNMTLKKLNLDNNHLSGRAIVSIINAINFSMSVRKLSLRGNGLLNLQEEMQISVLVKNNNSLDQMRH